MPGKTEVKIGPALGFDPAMQVPLAGEEGYHPKDAGDGFVDERFAPLDDRGSGVGSSGLKRFLQESLDREQAEKTPAAVVHVGDEQFRVYYKDGQWRAKGLDEVGTLHRFAGATRDEVLDKLAAFAKREAKEAFHELTRSEKLQVIRAAQAGDRLTAIGLYLRFAIGEARAAKYDSPFEMMADPELVPIMDKCCEFCWFHSNPHAIDTPDWHEYKERILAGRPATFDLLDATWLRYQDHLDKENRGALLRQFDEPKPKALDPRVIQEGLEDLDNNAVNRLMSDTKRHFAREVRAGRL